MLTKFLEYGTCNFKNAFYFLNGISGLSLRGGGRGFPPATVNVAPGYFHRKIEPKEIPSCVIPPPTCCFYPAT